MLSYRSASPGYWTVWLLPIAISFSGLNDKSISFLGVIAVNSIILTILHKNEVDFTVALARSRNVCLITGVVLFGWFYWFEREDAYMVFANLSLGFAFPYVFYNVVRYYPKSFTFGEAMIITQAFVFVFGLCAMSVPTPGNVSIAKNPDFIILFAQAGFLGVMIVSRLLVMSVKPWTFLFTEEFFCVWGKCCLAAMGYRLSVDDLWTILGWLGKFLQDRALLFLYCVVCCTVAIGFVHYKNLSRTQASTTDRKYFHFLMLAVYLPGIFVDREFLYLGSAAIMYIFVLSELVRALKLKFFGTTMGDKIDGSVRMFRDHQDEGKLILTPLYLLAGCSMPIWLMGVETPTSMLNGFDLAACMAGLLSIGVGDTFASIGGTAFGNTRWRGTNKSFGGTVFCLSSQLVFVWFLHFSGICAFSSPVLFAVILAAFVNSLVEALTDQIDNLVLPLLTFDLILLCSFIFEVYRKVLT